MNRLFKVIVADDEPFICGMLTKIIRCQELGLEVVGTANDGEQLLELIARLEPDIVITDIAMPKMDGLMTICSAREAGYRCRFVIISGYQQYRYAYNTLHNDVDDYLNKPVNAEELNRRLEKIVASLRGESEKASPKNHNILRAEFVEDGIRRLKDAPVELSALNARYHMSLKPGEFQLVLIRLEQLSAGRSPEDASSVVAKLHGLMEQEFSALCHETIYRKDADSVLVLLNYDAAKGELLQSRLRDLLEKTRSVTNMFMELGATVCVGKAVSDAAHLDQAKEWVLDAEWARMFYGVNRLIFSEELPAMSNRAFLVKLHELREEFCEAFTAMDVDAACACVESLFICPMNVLCSREARRFCRDLWRDFFTINRNRIDVFSNSAKMEKETVRALSVCVSLPAYRETFTKQMRQIMERVLARERANDRELLSRLERYMAEHYTSVPLLYEAAAQLGVEGSTLQQLLARERTDWDSYVRQYRVELAKQWLRDGRRPGRAFAAALGYENKRSFYFEFKSLTGVSPGEYRTIFH